MKKIHNSHLNCEFNDRRRWLLYYLLAKQRKHRNDLKKESQTMKYTSAEANKLLKGIEQKIRNILMMERRSSHFLVASGEDAESLRPKYDFAETQSELERLEAEVRKIKHAINCFNTTHTLPGFNAITIDQALVYIPQLSSRVRKLHELASSLPKERVENMRSNIIDYSLANYDIDAAEKAYEESQKLLDSLQLALDAVNTTETMEIEIGQL